MLACARLELEPHDASRARAAIKHGIDWDHFVPLANHHGVLPLIHRHLSTGALDAALIPVAAVAALRDEATRIARRNLMLSGQLATLLRAFATRNIRVVALKGPVLAQQLYGSVALRRFKDLDLLVAEPDVGDAMDAIAACGYARPVSLGPDIDALRRHEQHHIALDANSGTHQVELHDCLHPHDDGRRRTIDLIADRLERIDVFGVTAFVMAPEELLVYLCVHGTRHNWERIEWAASVAQLLRSGRVTDWRRANACAQRQASERAFRSGLQVVSALFDTRIPGAVSRRDRALEASARAIANQRATAPARRANPVECLVHQLRTDTGIRSRITRLWRTLIAPRVNDAIAMPLPRALWPLYYVLRPVRVLVRHMAGKHRVNPIVPE